MVKLSGAVGILNVRCGAIWLGGGIEEAWEARELERATGGMEDLGEWGSDLLGGFLVRSPNLDRGVVGGSLLKDCKWKATQRQSGCFDERVGPLYSGQSIDLETLWMVWVVMWWVWPSEIQISQISLPLLRQSLEILRCLQPASPPARPRWGCNVIYAS